MTEYHDRCAAIAAVLREAGAGSQEGEPELLVGFVVAAEYTTPSGTRWLARYVGDSDGDPTGISTWQGDGYLLHAMSERWDHESEEEGS